MAQDIDYEYTVGRLIRELRKHPDHAVVHVQGGPDTDGRLEIEKVSSLGQLPDGTPIAFLEVFKPHR